MNKDQIIQLLEEYKKGDITNQDIIDKIIEKPFSDIGYAKIDYHREIRSGYPEVVFCMGKSDKQIFGIVENILTNTNQDILLTKIEPKTAEQLLKNTGAVYNEEAKLLHILRNELKPSDKTVLVLSAGTSDIPVAKEAYLTAVAMGCKAQEIYDVGVAGLHRLLSYMDQIQAASVIIVVAGMEGALASVVAGLTSCPVIGVPTSVGYGASYKGVTALLSMMNSCANRVCVVNIDNGYGAGAVAASIVKQV